MSRGLGTGPVAVLLAVGVGLPACSAAEGTGPAAEPSPAAVRGPAPTLESAVLIDEVTRDAWTTTWHACFASADGDAMAGWQVRRLTIEGSSPDIEDLGGACIDLGVGQGVGSPETDPARAAALSDAASLTYQARGVRPDGTVTPWTKPVLVGTTRTGAG